MAEQNNNQQDLNQLLQVRYDKLHELQENGKIRLSSQNMM